MNCYLIECILITGINGYLRSVFLACSPICVVLYGGWSAKCKCSWGAILYVWHPYWIEPRVETGMANIAHSAYKKQPRISRFLPMRLDLHPKDSPPPPVQNLQNRLIQSLNTSYFLIIITIYPSYPKSLVSTAQLGRNNFRYMSKGAHSGRECTHSA